MSTGSTGTNTKQFPQGASQGPYPNSGVDGQSNTFGPQGAFGPASTGSGQQGGMEGQGLGTTGYTGQEAPQMGQGGMPQYSGLGQTPTPNDPLFPTQQSSMSVNYGGGGGGQNPYIGQQADAITQRFNRNLQESVLPGLRDKFVGSGGLGGSRQGIAEGLAAGRSGDGLAGALASLYGNAWEGDQNRAVSYAGIGSNANNAQMQNELGRLNSERNFYSTNRGQDLQQAGLAAGLLGQASQGFIGQGQGLYNLGAQEQNAPWQQLGNYSGLMQPYTQAGATNTGTNSQQYTYNPTMQYIGANMQAAASIAPYLMSDVRLKENIRPVGQTYDGLTTYVYNYKGDDVPQMGVMAQEVEQKRPDALGPTVNGFKSVRYGLLG